MSMDQAALDFALLRTRGVFHRPGLAALRLFLAALPEDAVLLWGEAPEWIACGELAERLQAELLRPDPPA
jgi:hypothetical protein